MRLEGLPEDEHKIQVLWLGYSRSYFTPEWIPPLGGENEGIAFKSSLAHHEFIQTIAMVL